MDTWRTEWIEKKQKIALSLNLGGCGGTYGEAVIILCSALSALAAEIWPGKNRIDRKRFVELIVKLSPSRLETTKISIPILVDYLQQKGRYSEMTHIEGSFLNYGVSHVLLGDKVDKFESEILAVCNTFSLKEIRKCSYANLLYEEIRSGYAHEYRPSDRAYQRAQTSRSASISYVNQLDKTNKPHRLIHFHIDWVANLAVKTAKVVDAAAVLPREQPSNWWIDGQV